MAKRKFSEDKILQILKEAEVRSVAAVCRDHKITGVTFYRWRTKYEGLKLNEAKKLKDIEEENRKLKKIVADEEKSKTLAGSFSQVVQGRLHWLSERIQKAAPGGELQTQAEIDQLMKNLGK